MKSAKHGNKYRIRKMINGKTYYFSFDHKPTKKEIENALFEKRLTNAPNCDLTFKSAAEEYIEVKSNVLSPATIVNYHSILKNLSVGFTSTKISNISSLIIQREINDYSVGRSPKSVRNANGFISTVLNMYAPEVKISVKLPQKVKTAEYYPTDDDVKRVLEYAKNSPYEIPLRLAVYGLRKSELLCIDKTCIDGNKLTINKAKVVNTNKEYVVKTTKTTSSTREIYIDDDLANKIREMDKPFDMFPGDILRYLHKAQDELGIPRFKLHSLRHFYISYAHSLGIPDSFIASSVGHASTITTRNTYLHVLENQLENKQKEVSNALTKLF